jgi:transposase
MRERQRQVQLYRGQIPSPGRPTVAWREDRVRFWVAIGRGASSEDAAREIGVSPAVGTRWFRQAGGVAPKLPPAVSGRYLSFAEREDIAIWHAQKAGVREIARRLGRSPSTISRELRRNASTRTWRLDYRASTAQWHAERRARRPKVSKLAADERLREYVQDRLAGVIRGPDGRPVPGPAARFIGRRHGPRQDRRWATCWSPEQIGRRLAADFPDDESMRVSHEAIYQALYIQGRGALRRELVACLRTGRALRVPRGRPRQHRDGMVTPEVMISARPAQAGDRAVPGHWEGDLERHEAPCNRAEVEGLRRWAVAAAWRSWGQPDPGDAGEGGKRPRQRRDGPGLPDGPGLASETGRCTRGTSAVTPLKFPASSNPVDMGWMAVRTRSS